MTGTWATDTSTTTDPATPSSWLWTMLWTGIRRRNIGQYLSHSVRNDHYAEQNPQNLGVGGHKVFESLVDPHRDNTLDTVSYNDI